MGEDTEDTLASLNISEKDRKQYDMAIAKFDDYVLQGQEGYSRVR